MAAGGHCLALNVVAMLWLALYFCTFTRWAFEFLLYRVCLVLFFYVSLVRVFFIFVFTCSGVWFRWTCVRLLFDACCVVWLHV